MKEHINLRELRKSVIDLPTVGRWGRASNKWRGLFTAELYFRKTLSDHVRQSFYMQIASMLKAGIDLHTAMNIAVDTQAGRGSVRVLKNIRDKVVNGIAFSEAIRVSGKFTVHEYFTIQVAEESGRIIEVFEELALYFQKKIKQRRLLVAALVYPATIIIVAIGAILFMLSYVVPMFADIFNHSGNQLPRITKLIISLSGLFKYYGGRAGGVVVILVSLLYWQRDKIWFRKWSAKLILHFPVTGKLSHQISLAQFCQSMALLLGSNVPLIRALQLAKFVVRLHSFQLLVQQIEWDVTVGTPLHAALQKHKFFPQKIVALVKVGEETNQLDVFFKQIAGQLSEDVEHRSSMLGKFIEPVIIIILGLFVGLILVAMYLPLFQLGEKF